MIGVRGRLSVWGLLLIMLWFCACGLDTSHPPEEARVMVVHSYHAEFSWTKTIDEGITAVLDQGRVRVLRFYLDSKRRSNEAYLRRIGQRALEMVRTFKPAVVITTDDNAQQYVGKYLVNQSGIGVVFCGVNEHPAIYGYPGLNVTGIRELPMVRSNLNLLKKILPQARTCTIFTSASATSDGFIRYFKELAPNISVDRFVTPKTFQQWKDLWLSIQSDAIITYEYHTLQENGEPIDPAEVFNWSVNHMNKPVIGFFREDIEGGFLLGQVQSGFEQGEQAAQKAMEIIKGKNASEIPITITRGGLIMINANTASMLGIDITPIENIADIICYRQPEQNYGD